MKVLLVNGSPHQNGCTATALKEIEETLNKQGIDTENFWIGTKPVAGCIGCGSCLKTGKCCIEDKVNEFLEKVEEAVDDCKKLTRTRMRTAVKRNMKKLQQIYSH